MSGLVDGLWYGETMFIKHLIEGEFSRTEEKRDVYTFMKAYSFCAERRERYIQDADFRLPI
jgi:hypothetical protein